MMLSSDRNHIPYPSRLQPQPQDVLPRHNAPNSGFGGRRNAPVSGLPFRVGGLQGHFQRRNALVSGLPGVPYVALAV
jgi:hypothetical protein